MGPSQPPFSGSTPEPVAASSALGAPEVGRYEPEGEVGRGGMGVVERAHDRRLGRVVAVKHPKDAAAGAALVREARLVAQLDHPGIVAVHDAGVGPDGLPWVAMRLVRGRTLADALAAEPGSWPTFVRAFLAACEAVAYAHRLGVVHRDLSPANLLVGELGDTQVSDWGLARALPGRGWERILGELPPAGAAGTPGWISPQQAAGLAPDPRDDVYSLGAVLAAILGEAGPPELVAIGRKARSPEPEARYPSAAELAADVARWLDGRRVHAYDYAPHELAGRLIRAWRAPLAVAGVAAAVLAVGIGTSWVSALRERERAVAAEADTRAALALADERLGAALLAQAVHAESRGATAEAEVLAAEALGLGQTIGARGVLAAVGASPRPTVVSAVALADGCRPVPHPAGDGWLCIGGGLRRFGPDGSLRWRSEGAVADAVFAGPRVAVHPGQEAAVIWLDGATGGELGRAAGRGASDALFGAPSGAVVSVHGQTVDRFGGAAPRVTRCAGARTMWTAALSDDGRQLAALCSDGEIERSDLGSGPVVAAPTALRHTLASAYTARFLPDGDLIVGTARGEVVRLAPDGHTRWSAAPLTGPVQHLCADGSTVAAVADRGGPVVLDAATGRLRARLAAADRGPCAFVGGDLVTHAAAVRRWRFDDAPASRLAHAGGITWVGLDGGDVLVTAADGDAVRWGPDGDVLQRFHWQERVVKAGALLPDDTWVATGLGEPGLRVLGRDGVLGAPLAAHGRPWRRLGALASGWVWGSSYGASVDLIRPADGAASSVAGMEALEVTEGWTTLDGRFALLADTAGGLWRLRGEDPPRAERVGEADGVVAVALTPDGGLLAVVTGDTLSLREGAVVRSRAIPPSTDAAIGPDGRWLAVGGLDGVVRVYALPSGEPHAELRGHAERIGGLAYSADGRWLVSAAWDGTVRRWSLEALDRAPDAARARAAAWGITAAQALDAGR